MLYIIHRANHPNLAYKGGQGPIVHLEANLHETVRWAEENNLRWAFTLSNAGAYYFEDRCDLAQLEEVDWKAVHATDWKRCQEGKQAEFLVERQFPWELVARIGVYGGQLVNQVTDILETNAHKPTVNAIPQWYY